MIKVKDDQKEAEIKMDSTISDGYNQMRATDLSALLFKGMFYSKILKSIVKRQLCMTFAIKNKYFAKTKRPDIASIYPIDNLAYCGQNGK